MEQFGWTERELYEEVTKGRIQQILAYREMQNKAQKVREQREKVRAKH